MIHYGIVSDLHDDPNLLPVTLAVLRRQGAEKFIVNGDLCDQKSNLERSQEYFSFVLDSIGKSGLESYVQPGSRDTFLVYEPVMAYFKERYSNIIDAAKEQAIERKDHSLIFLPGTDIFSRGEYLTGNLIPSGRYVQAKDSLLRFETLDQYIQAHEQGIAEGVMEYSNMNDLRHIVTDPDKSIMISHIPRRFDYEGAVDMVEFGEVTEDFLLNERMIPRGAVMPMQAAKDIAKMGYPLKLRKENRGNVCLKELYEEIGIKKAISGHFHESGHRAHDRGGNRLLEGELCEELFWNTGHLDAGQAGILTVYDGKVKYKNIRLAEHLH
ncbi:MAG: hypothetical protein R6V53_03660 [Candidatus Woesearchaeota archaeon]